MKKIIGLVAIALFLILPEKAVKAQSDSTTDLSYYFDDDEISTSKHIVKLNLLTVLNGDLPLHYEYVISNSFAVEVGVGLLLPYYFPDILQKVYNNPGIIDPNFGYSLWLFPKFYLARSAPEDAYIGIEYRQRNFNLDSYKATYTDVTAHYGFQLIWGKRLVFDYSVGIGYRFERQDPNGGLVLRREWAAPLRIKVGILL